MTQPYKELTDYEKKVFYHDDPAVQHSGILPSGEGHYYDKSHVLVNSNNYEEATLTSPSNRVIQLGGPSNLVDTPAGDPPETFQPSGLRFTNTKTKITNGQIAIGARLPDNQNGISNAEIYPPQTYTQGPYIHYYISATGILSDDDGAIEYFAGTGLNVTPGGYYPYGGGPQ